MAIKKLLIANRGEIAIRIMRTCREMGIRTVAVYSEDDRHSIHTAFADEAVAIGESEAAKSYLRIERLVDAAKQTEAHAIHPGYGFLSERPELVDACDAAGIVFVGPPASAMRALGDKISAKSLAVAGGVPVVPGFFEPGASPSKLKEEARRVGYPVMLKASAGGGGRGMRAVRSEEEFDDALSIAANEAMKAFGDGTMMLEKLIENPRHVEAQVLADAHGNVACLYERECSIQRRHQKLIEEAPSPFFDSHPEIWEKMRDAVRSLIPLAGYRNAGTVEFIVDPMSGEFYFLEVNARLQVEHPVTEAITGLDLVRWQIRIAEGEKLDFSELLIKGERSRINGHAIEARIIAEDPGRGFLPSAGKILGWSEPQTTGVRVDAGFAAGSEISRFYDSLIAKVIGHGETRADAIDRLRAALLDFHVLGVRTNISYLLEVLDHPEFRAGRIDTGFLDRNFSEWSAGKVPVEVGAISELAMATSSKRADRQERLPAWSLADNFRNVRGR